MTHSLVFATHTHTRRVAAAACETQPQPARVARRNWKLISLNIHGHDTSGNNNAHEGEEEEEEENAAAKKEEAKIHQNAVAAAQDTRCGKGGLGEGTHTQRTCLTCRSLHIFNVPQSCVCV